MIMLLFDAKGTIAAKASQPTWCSHWQSDGSSSVLVGEARPDEPGRQGTLQQWTK